MNNVYFYDSVDSLTEHTSSEIIYEYLYWKACKRFKKIFGSIKTEVKILENTIEVEIG